MYEPNIIAVQSGMPDTSRRPVRSPAEETQEKEEIFLLVELLNAGPEFVRALRRTR